MRTYNFWSIKSLYIGLLGTLLAYYAYCGYTDRRLFEWGSSSQWSPAGEAGSHGHHSHRHHK